MINDLDLEDLTPFLQEMIKLNVALQWFDIQNKHNLSIDGFLWASQDNDDDWDEIDNILNNTEYKKEYYLGIDDELTDSGTDWVVSDQEMEHFQEIVNSFPEYLV